MRSSRTDGRAQGERGMQGYRDAAPADTSLARRPPVIRVYGGAASAACSA